MPRRILIQGGGYIAVEFASIFAGLGSEVTLVYRGENILRGFDDDVREHLRSEMRGRGITVNCGQTVTAIDKSGDEFVTQLSDNSTIIADNVMFAVGRRPNVMRLGIERLNVKIREHGGIEVDEYSRTTTPNVYAVGDVTDRVNLTPVAIREGHAFADTVYGGKPTPVDHSNVPTAVFSEPKSASWTHRGSSARAVSQGRCLQDHVSSNEGDSVRSQHALVHEAIGRRRY